MKKTIEKIPKVLSVFLLFVLISITSKAQNSITGKVTDSKGAPAQGVTVTVKGSKTATQTGADGTFKISVPSAKWFGRCELTNHLRFYNHAASQSLFVEQVDRHDHEPVGRNVGNT